MAYNSRYQSSFGPDPGIESDQGGFLSPRARRQVDFSPDFSLADYQAPEPESSVSNADRYFSDVRSMYDKTPALDMYRRELQNMPKPEDYRPSGWDRVAAGLSGLSAGMKDAGRGIEVARGMNRSRYDTALSDYYNQIKPMHEMASLERQNIDDQVGYIMKANELGIKYDDYQRQLESDRGKQRVAEGELGVKRGELDWKKTYEGGRLKQYDKDVNSLADYRGATGAAASRNAATSAFEAQTGRRNQESLTPWRQADIEVRRANAARGNVPTGATMSTVQQDELSMLKSKYPTLITSDSDGRLSVNQVPEAGTPEYFDYQQMQQELQNRMNYRLRTGQVDFMGGNGDIDLSGDVPGSRSSFANSPWEPVR